MSIGDNSLAAGIGIGVENVVLKSGADILQRKVLVMGTPLAAKVASVNLAVPQLITNPEDGINRYGAGSMLARLIAAAFRGANYAVPVFAFPEAEAEAGVLAVGALVFTDSTPDAGTIPLRIAGKLYPITTKSTSTPTSIGDDVVAAMAADPDCPAVGVNTTGSVAVTAKSKGPYGNGITLSIAARPQDGEVLPSGVTVTITAMATGAGLPALATDLPLGLGSGDSANEQGFTDVVHGYGKDATILDALLAYVGAGNEEVGLYADTVGRPFRVLTGDTTVGSAGLTAAIALGNGRKLDRASGCISKPGSLTNPAEIAAVAIGVVARINNGRAEENYVDVILPGVDIGNAARLAGEDWTTQYANRDAAVKAGISPTTVEDGVVKLQNMVSFYHPATVPVTSNAYREFVNLSKVQNILAAKRVAYKSAKWQGFSIVKDTKNVMNATSRAKARDKGDVIDTELSLINAFAARAWIYDRDYSIAALKAAGAVTVREGGDGFKVRVPYILSGVGNIIDNQCLVDTSIAVLTA